jgi:exopolysaccharide biosynthesis polyprenyl glycosylphosphotransferase
MSGAAPHRAVAPSAAAPSPQQESRAVAGVVGPPRELDQEHLRSPWPGRAKRITYALIDVVLASLGGITAFWLRFGTWGSTVDGSFFLNVFSFPKPSQAYMGFFLLYCGLVVLACISQDLYRTPRDISGAVETLRVLKAVPLATALLVLFIFTSGNKEISRSVVAVAGAINVVTFAGWRMAKRQYVLRRAGRGIGLSRVLIIGSGSHGHALASWMENNRHLGYSVCGFLDVHPNGDDRVLGPINDLRRVALAHFADEVFITPPVDGELVKQVFLEARRLRLNVHVLPDLYDGLGWRAPIDYIGGFPLLRLYSEPIPAVGLAVKRMMDMLLAVVGLVLFAPVLALASIWIRLDSPGAAIYRAPRVGKKGQKFVCYKMRTMVADADAQKNELRKVNEREGPFFKMEDDPRLTRCGKWLRRYSLDELPQLVNVLRGDMSLVGPRPHPIDDYERYTIEDVRRLEVKPGITGLWQVTARRDPSFDTNMALDLEYIENWSLALDLKILFRTVPAALRGEGR